MSLAALFTPVRHKRNCKRGIRPRP